MKRFLLIAAAAALASPALAAGVRSHGHGVAGVIDGGHPRRVEYLNQAPPGRPAYWSTGKRMRGCSYRDRPITNLNGAPATMSFLNCNVRFIDPPQQDLWRAAERAAGERR